MTTPSNPEEILTKLIESLNYMVDECYKHSKDNVTSGNGRVPEILQKLHESYWSGMGNALNTLSAEAEVQYQCFLVSLSDDSQQQET